MLPLGGVAREIEDPSGSMEHFYESLARVALERPGAVSRILIYSVSTNGSDRVSGALRAGLQERFGDAGKGFVPMAPGWSSQEHRDLDWKHRHYVTRVVNRGKDPSGRYGLAGVLAVSRGPLAESSFGTEDSGPSNREVSRFDLFYQAWPEGPEVELRVDDRSPELISTAAPEPVDRLHRIEAPRGPHELTVGAEGQGARFYGVAMENDGPGVVVDALMLIGNSVEMLPHWSYEHLQKQVELRAPDLVVLWLGGNDVRARRFTHEWFVRHYGEFIENLRAGRPEASCLVLSTLDKGLMRNGRVVSRRRVQRVRDAQLATASEQGCAFFDLYEATGGFGTVERWYNARPRLMVDDLNHLTFTGARVVGSVMEKALLAGYDAYFDRLRSRAGG
jgi:lysophospholipase L1-like esterase